MDRIETGAIGPCFKKAYQKKKIKQNEWLFKGNVQQVKNHLIYYSDLILKNGLPIVFQEHSCKK